MEYVEISNIQDRIIRFGLSEVEHCKYGEDIHEDLWWNVHVIVQKPGIDYNVVSESMTQTELLELVEVIKATKNRNEDKDKDV